MTVVPLLLALAACGDAGPGPDDIKAAIHNAYGSNITEAKNVSCSKDQNDASYSCTYDLVGILPGKTGATERDHLSGQFGMTGGKWALFNHGEFLTN